MGSAPFRLDCPHRLRLQSPNFQIIAPTRPCKLSAIIKLSNCQTIILPNYQSIEKINLSSHYHVIILSFGICCLTQFFSQFSPILSRVWFAVALAVPFVVFCSPFVFACLCLFCFCLCLFFVSLFFCVFALFSPTQPLVSRADLLVVYRQGIERIALPCHNT